MCDLRCHPIPLASPQPFSLALVLLFRTPKGAPAEAGPQELIVVTILVAAEGAFKLPKITSRADLKKALARLGSVPVDDILAVEVLWTPEEEGDFFTLQDLAIDYPLLNTL